MGIGAERISALVLVEATKTSQIGKVIIMMERPRTMWGR